MAARTGVLLVVVVAGAGFALWRWDTTRPALAPEPKAAPEEFAPETVSEALAKVSPPSPGDRVRAALAREVSFPGVEDPKTTLREVLDRMARQWGVRFDVKGEDADKLLKREVARQGPIPPMRMQADWVLWSVLESVPGDDPPGMGGPPVTGERLAYFVSEGDIVVAPRDWLAERGLRPERPSRDTPRMAAKARAVREKLARVVDFPGADDPRTTLGDALARLARDYGLTFYVYERAFQDERLNLVRRAPVAETPVPRMRAPLYLVVATILARVPVPSGATFVVIGGHVWVGTNGGFQQQGIGPEPAKLTARMKRQLTDYRTALARTVSFPGVENPRATLGELLEQLGKAHDLTFSVDEYSFKYFGLNDVLRTQVASPRPIPALKAPVATVLQLILDRVPMPERSRATFAVRPGVIAVAAGPADLAGE